MLFRSQAHSGRIEADRPGVFWMTDDPKGYSKFGTVIAVQVPEKSVQAAGVGQFITSAKIPSEDIIGVDKQAPDNPYVPHGERMSFITHNEYAESYWQGYQDTKKTVEQKNSVMKGADFDESKHPRNPAGSPNSTGGQFASTDEGGNSTFSEKPNASDRIINSPILTIGVSDAELEALESYITIGYTDINGILRKGHVLFGEAQPYEIDQIIDEIKSLTNVLDRQSLPENVTVYRGTDSMLNKALKAGVGGIIDDNGFVSKIGRAHV